MNFLAFIALLQALIIVVFAVPIIRKAWFSPSPRVAERSRPESMRRSSAD